MGHPASGAPQPFRIGIATDVLIVLRCSHRAIFVKKIRTQKEPKSLPQNAIPGLQICHNCLCDHGSAHPAERAGFKEADLWQGSGMEGRKRERADRSEKKKEREGRNGKVILRGVTSQWSNTCSYVGAFSNSWRKPHRVVQVFFTAFSVLVCDKISGRVESVFHILYLIWSLVKIFNARPTGMGHSEEIYFLICCASEANKTGAVGSIGLRLRTGPSNGDGDSQTDRHQTAVGLQRSTNVQYTAALALLSTKANYITQHSLSVGRHGCLNTPTRPATTTPTLPQFTDSVSLSVGLSHTSTCYYSLNNPI